MLSYIVYMLRLGFICQFSEQQSHSTSLSILQTTRFDLDVRLIKCSRLKIHLLAFVYRAFSCFILPSSVETFTQWNCRWISLSCKQSVTDGAFRISHPCWLYLGMNVQFGRQGGNVAAVMHFKKKNVVTWIRPISSSNPSFCRELFSDGPGVLGADYNTFTYHMLASPFAHFVFWQAANSFPLCKSRSQQVRQDYHWCPWEWDHAEQFWVLNSHQCCYFTQCALLRKHFGIRDVDETTQTHLHVCAYAKSSPQRCACAWGKLG